MRMRRRYAEGALRVVGAALAAASLSASAASCSARSNAAQQSPDPGESLILPMLVDLPTGSANPNGSTEAGGVGPSQDVSSGGILLCATGGREPVRVVSVALMHSRGLRLTGFALRPNPVAHGGNGVTLGVTNRPLRAAGFATLGPGEVPACRPDFRDVFPSTHRATAELAFSVRVTSASAGSASGVTVFYKNATRLAELDVVMPIRVDAA